MKSQILFFILSETPKVIYSYGLMSHVFIITLRNFYLFLSQILRFLFHFLLP